MVFSPIKLEPRKGFNPKQRAVIFSENGGVCHLCNGPIQAGQAWDVDHVKALGMGGTNDAANLRPAHAKCHRGVGSKTSDDVKAISRADRLAKKHFGITPKKKGRLQSRPFPKRVKD
jgi:5-methylcytosine-specific restriction endonuclease McrA